MFDYTQCAGVMIGRAALSMPWIFRDTWSYLTTGAIPLEPTISEKCNMMRAHFHNLVRFRSERSALIEFRKRVSWYAKTMNPCRSLRDPMREIQSIADFDEVMNRFEEWRVDYDRAVASGRRPWIEEDALVAAGAD